MGDRYVPAGDREDAILQNRSQPLLFARNRILSRTVAWGRLEEVAHTRAVGKSGANKEKSQNGTVTTAGQVLFGLARPVHHLDWRGALKLETSPFLSTPTYKFMHPLSRESSKSSTKPPDTGSV